MRVHVIISCGGRWHYRHLHLWSVNMENKGERKWSRGGCPRNNILSSSYNNNNNNIIIINKNINIIINININNNNNNKSQIIESSLRNIRLYWRQTFWRHLYYWSLSKHNLCCLPKQQATTKIKILH